MLFIMIPFLKGRFYFPKMTTWLCFILPPAWLELMLLIFETERKAWNYSMWWNDTKLHLGFSLKWNTSLPVFPGYSLLSPGTMSWGSPRGPQKGPCIGESGPPVHSPEWPCSTKWSSSKWVFFGNIPREEAPTDTPCKKTSCLQQTLPNYEFITTKRLLFF